MVKGRVRQGNVRCPRVAIFLQWDTADARAMGLGIARYAAAHGPWAFFVRNRWGFEPLMELAQWNGNGIIAPIHEDEDEDFVRDICATGIVTVNVATAPGFPIVTKDNAAAGRLAAEYLMEQGHRHFGHVGRNGINYVPQRRAGFIETVRRAGLDETVYEPAPLERMPVKWKSVHGLLVRWLKSLPKPIGVMVCDDSRGREVIEAARECGVLVPDEVAIVSVGNDEVVCDFCDPPLSSISIRGEQVGYEAAKLLDHLMAGGAPPAEPILISPDEVIVRRSSDMLAIADANLAAAVRFIRENGNRPIGVTDVLEKVPLSRRSLERRFAAVVGHTPWREIRLAQVAHVKKLLSDTDMSMPKVAAASAFYDAKRLRDIFKEETGATPTAYRRQFRTV